MPIFICMRTNPVAPAPGAFAFLDQVLSDGAVRSRFQALLDLVDGTVRGYEALSRGPEGPLENPRELFSVAAREGRLLELERLCWTTALAQVPALGLGAPDAPLLFLNVLAEEFADTSMLDWMDEQVRAAGMSPSRIVLEISEAVQIHDFRVFAARLDRFRALGFRVALDDVGSGHAGLQTLVELQPDFIKVDQSLVRDVYRDEARRGAIEALALFAVRIGATLIAEGIETAAELNVVRDLGVHWGQGYLLGCPAAEPTTAMVERAAAAYFAVPAPGAGAGRQTRVGTLVERVPVVAPEAELGRVLDLFESEATDTLVIVRDDLPLGLLHRRRILELLSRPYGREVHLRRPVEQLADEDFLVVEARQSLEDVSRLATARRADALYDVIAVTRDGTYVGVVSVRQLLDAITAQRMEIARHSNPLTGLPGNASIESELRGRLESRRGVGVMHIDLDAFKAFNDLQGFHRGDQAIRLTARVVSDAVGRLRGAAAFVGHIGGDDFLAIVDMETLHTVAAEIQARFGQQVPQLYSECDRRRGYVMVRSRDGALARQPLMSVTVATKEVAAGSAAHYADVLDQLAEAKRIAKAQNRGTYGIPAARPATLA